MGTTFKFLKNKLFICLVSVTAFGCNSENKGINVSKNGLYTVNLNPNFNQQIKLSDYFSKVSYLLLESNPNSVFGTISKIKFSKSKIYILDKKNARALFVFNRAGKFLFKIGKPGHGPGEFVYLWDFSVNPVTEEITLFDLSTNKIKFFSANGDIQNEKTLPVQSFYMDYMNGNSLALFNHFDEDNDPYDLTILNGQSKIEAQAFPNHIEKLLKNATYTQEVFYNNGNDHFFIHPYTDTIYRIANNKVHADYVFKFNGKELPANVLADKKIKNLGDFLAKGNYVTSIGNFYKVNHTLFFSYIFNSDIKFGIADIKNQKVLSTSMVLNDLSQYLPFNGFIGAESKDKLVSYIDISSIIDLKELVAKRKLTLPDDLAALLKKTDDNSNTILATYSYGVGK